jgi:hypothetical protein
MNDQSNDTSYYSSSVLVFQKDQKEASNAMQMKKVKISRRRIKGKESSGGMLAHGLDSPRV